MNLDTPQKRMSAVGIGLPFLRSQYNDSGHSQAWRQNAAYAYTGILAGTPAAGGVPPLYYYQTYVLGNW